MRHSRSDERAMLAIAGIMVISIGIIMLIEHFKPVEQREQPASAPELTEDEIAANLHSFDPNTVDSTTLLSFGLRPHQIKTFLNYRRKGARFYTPESIERIYTWDDETIERLLPFVTIDKSHQAPPRAQRTDPSRKQYDAERNDAYEHRQTHRSEHSDSTYHYAQSNKFTSPTMVDINTADSALLTRIPGIGAVTARSIIRLRNKLGGFHSTGQLKQIDYLRDNPELLSWLTASAIELKTIDINHATFNTLRQHPYITYDQARGITEVRRTHGSFRDLQALKGLGIFSDEELQRLAPYISFVP